MTAPLSAQHQHQHPGSASRADSSRSSVLAKPESVALGDLEQQPALPSTLDTHSSEEALESTSEPRAMRRLRVQFAALQPIVKVFRWLQGPQQPEEIRPRVFAFEARLERRLDSYTRLLRRHWLIPALYLVGWLIMAAFLVRESWFSSTTSEGSPTLLSKTSSFWSKDAGCGLDGSSCAPFNESSLAFRCPASAADTQLLNYRAVGAQEVIYTQLIVGGGDAEGTYRADSWICSAALQQGLISSRYGGCGVAQQVGQFQDFQSLNAHGLNSVSFDSSFPSAYRVSSSGAAHCKDLKFIILAVNVAMIWLFLILFRPRARLTWWVTACVGFWQVALTSNGPPDISAAFGTFLPCLFMLHVLWLCSAQFTLPAFDGYSLEKAFAWGLFFWIGCLLDMTLESWIPIDRLTPDDINRQPGGLVAVIIIVLIIAVLALAQLWYIRKQGRLLFYLKWYAVGGILLGILASLPDLQLRLHQYASLSHPSGLMVHSSPRLMRSYITALILIPLAALPTRVSLLILAFLLGMFLNGAALWGFDSILQTAEALRRDAPLGTQLPSFAVNAPVDSAQISWQPIPQELESDWDGFALLVNDVLRYEGDNTTVDISDYIAQDLPTYLRLAYMQGDDEGDFTKAGILHSDASWTEPESGPS